MIDSGPSPAARCNPPECRRLIGHAGPCRPTYRPGAMCGVWMPKAGEHCARFTGHTWEHRTRYALDNNRNWKWRGVDRGGGMTSGRAKTYHHVADANADALRRSVIAAMTCQSCGHSRTSLSEVARQSKVSKSALSYFLSGRTAGGYLAERLSAWLVTRIGDVA